MAPSRVPRSGWTDDDGTGTYGTIINNAELQKIYDGIDQLFSGNAPYATLEVGGAFKAAYLIGEGSNVTNLNGSQVGFGTVAPQRLGTGSPNSATVLRGDGVWTVIGTEGSLDPPYGPDGNAPFTAIVGYFFNLRNAAGGYVVMPYLSQAKPGQIIGFVQKEAGSSWPIYCQAGEMIAGQNPFTFNWPQWSTLVLKADPANGKWDPI